MSAAPGFDDYLDDMIVAVADRQTGGAITPIDLLELHKELFFDRPPTWVQLAPSEMQARGYGRDVSTLKSRSFMISGGGASRAQYVREMRRPKTPHEKLVAIPRSEWIALGALAVALLGLLPQVAPPVRAYFDSGSDVVFGRPAIDGNRLRVAATNKGEDSAVFERATIRSSLLPQTVQFKLDEASSAHIAPGSQVIAGRLTVIMAPDTLLDWLYENEEKLVANKPAAEATFVSIGSDGSERRQVVKIDGLDLYGVLAQHSFDCLDNGEQPTIANGCIDLGSAKANGQREAVDAE